MPVVRAIARDAAKDDWRVQTIIKGIVMSPGFTLRRVPAPPAAVALAASGWRPHR
jgi:hypothetical protein